MIGYLSIINIFYNFYLKYYLMIYIHLKNKYYYKSNYKVIKKDLKIITLLKYTTNT